MIGRCLTAAELTAFYPAGTPCRFWPGALEGEGRISAIASEWYELSSGDVVVHVRDYPGYIHAAHVRPNGSSGLEAVCVGSWVGGNNCGLCKKCRETALPPPPLIMWMLACNDRHGNFTGRVEMMTFDHAAGDMVELEGPGLQIRWCGESERRIFGGVYRRARHQLKIYGRGRLPVFRRQSHVGNIHWDQIGMPVPYAVALCNWLRCAGWHMLAGPCRLSEVWGRDDPHAVAEEELLWQDGVVHE